MLLVYNYTSYSCKNNCFLCFLFFDTQNVNWKFKTGACKILLNLQKKKIKNVESLFVKMSPHKILRPGQTPQWPLSWFGTAHLPLTSKLLRFNCAKDRIIIPNSILLVKVWASCVITTLDYRRCRLIRLININEVKCLWNVFVEASWRESPTNGWEGKPTEKPGKRFTYR